jgi:hypothetical protein
MKRDIKGGTIEFTDQRLNSAPSANLLKLFYRAFKSFVI